MAQDIVADVLLAICVLLVLTASLGVLVMRNVYEKIHFVTPIALVAPLVAALAVLVHQGLDESTSESFLALGFVAIGGPFLSHATIRAARRRDRGDWRVLDTAKATDKGPR